MAANYQWHGGKLQALVLAEVRRRLAVAAIVVWNHAKSLINVEGTGKTGQGKKAKLVYGAHPSAPGDPPRKQTGRLLGSVAWEVSDLVARVGTNVKYGRWLELGTKTIAPRPWLRRALAEKKGQVESILSAPIHLPEH